MDRLKKIMCGVTDDELERFLDFVAKKIPAFASADMRARVKGIYAGDVDSSGELRAPSRRALPRHAGAGFSRFAAGFRRETSDDKMKC